MPNTVGKSGFVGAGKKSLRYFLFYKPFGVLCQFTDSGGRPTLSRYGRFPRDVYPAGRLDTDSEGLVLLTNDGRLKHFLLDPKYGHVRTYCVQVENIPSEDALTTLRSGIVIGGKKTLPAVVYLMEKDPDFPPRPVPIRFRKNVPTAWIEIRIKEGRNRQVRRMTAAVGHPALRLVRTHFHHWSLAGLQPGEYREFTPRREDLAAPNAAQLRISSARK